MNPEIQQDETDPELVRRIRRCAEMVGSGDELSRRTGIPRRSLENYLSGRTIPKLKPLIAIAKKAGVTLDWLATGEGPMRPEAAKTSEPPAPSGGSASGQPLTLIRPVLEGVIQGTEIALQRLGKSMTPKEKAQVVSTLYNISHRRYVMRMAGQEPIDLDHEFEADATSADVMDFLRLIGERERDAK